MIANLQKRSNRLIINLEHHIFADALIVEFIQIIAKRKMKQQNVGTGGAPMTNEPTTGEIVRALRFCYESEEIECYECPCRVSGGAYLCHMDKLADRLESQEQKLELLNGGDFDVIDIPAALAYLESVEEILPHASALIDLIQSLKGTAIELTARAEQAEADIKKFAHTSHTCGHNESGLCKLAADDHGFCEKCPAWVYRGQPQDGEGK